MAFYDRLQATANRLIASRGKPATLVRQVQTGPDYDPQTSEQTFDVHLVETGYSLTNRDSTLVQTGDKLGLISAAGQAPQLDDKIVIDGARYSLMDVQPLNPGGTTLLFDFKARR